jgi:hypothetical protein
MIVHQHDNATYRKIWQWARPGAEKVPFYHLHGPQVYMDRNLRVSEWGRIGEVPGTLKIIRGRVSPLAGTAGCQVGPTEWWTKGVPDGISRADLTTPPCCIPPVNPNFVSQVQVAFTASGPYVVMGHFGPFSASQTVVFQGWVRVGTSEEPAVAPDWVLHHQQKLHDGSDFWWMCFSKYFAPGEESDLYVYAPPDPENRNNWQVLLFDQTSGECDPVVVTADFGTQFDAPPIEAETDGPILLDVLLSYDPPVSPVEPPDDATESWVSTGEPTRFRTYDAIWVDILAGEFPERRWTLSTPGNVTCVTLLVV